MGFVGYKPLPFESIRVCKHPEHDPHGMIVLKPGTHTWKCPGCGKTQQINVSPPPTLRVERDNHGFGHYGHNDDISLAQFIEKSTD